MIMKMVGFYSSDCEHVWTTPSCETGRECKICGYTRGTPLGHTTTSGICERCGKDVFPNANAKLLYYVKKNGSGYPAVISNNAKIDGVTVYTWVSATAVESTSEFEFVAFYEDNSLLALTFTIPYVGSYYNYQLNYYEDADHYNRGEGYWIGNGGISCNTFKASTRLRMSSYYIDDKSDLSFWEQEATDMLDMGLRSLNSTTMGKSIVGGVTLKDLGFKNY